MLHPVQEPIIDMNSPKASSYQLEDVFTKYLDRNGTSGKPVVALRCAAVH